MAVECHLDDTRSHRSWLNWFFACNLVSWSSKLPKRIFLIPLAFLFKKKENSQPERKINKIISVFDVLMAFAFALGFVTLVAY